MHPDLALAAHIECPEQYTGDKPRLFLAGGIAGCPDWQAEAFGQIAHLPIAVLNPRRRHFPIGQPEAAEEQIVWEFGELTDADVILFWFPDSGPGIPQPIALLELGRYLALGRTVAVGADPNFVRRADVVIQTRLARPELTVRSTLRQTVADAVALLPQGD